MKIGFLITARLKSSRLPLKLLLDLNGKTILERVIERCKKVADVSDIILCTSLNPQDKALVDCAKKNDIYYFLGDEMDVLRRLSDAASFYNLDYIINITGENPLFSIYHADIVVDLAKKGRHDFIFIEGLPVGCAIYGIRPEALKTVCSFKQEIDTEIWGPLINRPEIFDVKKVEVTKEIQLSNIRITCDYIEDYLFILEIFKHFPSDHVPSYFEVFKLLKEKPELMEINSSRVQAGLLEETLLRINEFFVKNKNRIEELKREFYLYDKR